MSLPDQAALTAALEATWPSATQRREGPWMLHDGQGGGRRTAAATAIAPPEAADIATAEAAMRALGIAPIFRLRPILCPWDADLDAMLEARGYRHAEPTVFYAAPTGPLAAAAPTTGLGPWPIWPPLAIQRALWAEAGIGPERLAVMARAAGPRTALMARAADRVAGTAFVACASPDAGRAAGPVAMLHALEVAPALRRRGVGRAVMHSAAAWAAGEGAEWLSLAVTEANAPARALYEALGFARAGGYHYRTAPAPSEAP